MAVTKKKYTRGENPNSLANLKDHHFTKEQDRELAARNGKKGGLSLQASNRKKIIIREIMEQAVQAVIRNDDTGLAENAVEAGIAKMVARFAKTGSVRDLEAIVEQLGQKPAEKVEQVVITPEVDFDKLADLRKALRDDD